MSTTAPDPSVFDTSTNSKGLHVHVEQLATQRSISLWLHTRGARQISMVIVILHDHTLCSNQNWIFSPQNQSDMWCRRFISVLTKPLTEFSPFRSGFSWRKFCAVIFFAKPCSSECSGFTQKSLFFQQKLQPC